MFYSRGTPADDKAHAEFCASVARSASVVVQLKRLLKERGRGVEVLPCSSSPSSSSSSSSAAAVVELSAATSSTYALGKLQALQRIMAEYMGVTEVSNNAAAGASRRRRRADTRYYLYVDSGGAVVGCLAAQTIRRASVARSVAGDNSKGSNEGGGGGGNAGGNAGAAGAAEMATDLMLVTHVAETAPADIGVSTVSEPAAVAATAAVAVWRVSFV